jgi:hypothetical protein
VPGGDDPVYCLSSDEVPDEDAVSFGLGCHDRKSPSDWLLIWCKRPSKGNWCRSAGLSTCGRPYRTS